MQKKQLNDPHLTGKRGRRQSRAGQHDTVLLQPHGTALLQHGAQQGRINMCQGQGRAKVGKRNNPHVLGSSSVEQAGAASTESVNSVAALHAKGLPIGYLCSKACSKVCSPW